MANIPPNQYGQYQQFDENNSAQPPSSIESTIIYQQEPVEQRYTSLLTGMSAVGTAFGNIVYESDGIEQGQYYNAANAPTPVVEVVTQTPTVCEGQYLEAVVLQTAVHTSTAAIEDSLPVTSVSNTAQINSIGAVAQDAKTKTKQLSQEIAESETKLYSEEESVQKYGGKNAEKNEDDSSKQMANTIVKRAEINLEQLAHVAIESQQTDRDNMLNNADVSKDLHEAIQFEQSSIKPSSEIALSETSEAVDNSSDKPKRVRKKNVTDKSKPRYIKLPAISQTNLGEHDLLIEVDIDDDLFVSPLKKEDSCEGRTKYFFTVSLQVPKNVETSKSSNEKSCSASEPDVTKKRRRRKGKQFTEALETVTVKIEENVIETINLKSKSPMKETKSTATRSSLKRNSKQEVDLPTTATVKSKRKKYSGNVKDVTEKKVKADFIETTSRRKSKRVKIKNRRFLDSDTDDVDSKQETEGRDMMTEEQDVETDEPEMEFEIIHEPGQHEVVHQDTTESPLCSDKKELDVNADIQAEIDEIFAHIKTETGDVADAPKSKTKRSKKVKESETPRQKRKYVKRGVYTKDDTNYTVRRTETGEKRYECNICRQTVGNVTYIRQHLALHSEDRPYQCEQCDLSFKTLNYLKKHTIIHGAKNVTCHICGTQFHSTDQLKSHEMVHSDRKQFRCSTCGRGFNHTTTLKRHSYTHVGFKTRHQCHLCGATFNRKSNLQRHIIDLHAQEGMGKRLRSQQEKLQQQQLQFANKQQNIKTQPQHVENQQQQQQLPHGPKQQQQLQHVLKQQQLLPQVHKQQQQSLGEEELQFEIQHIEEDLPSNLASTAESSSNVYIAQHLPWTIVHEITDVPAENQSSTSHIQLVAVPLPQNDMHVVKLDSHNLL